MRPHPALLAIAIVLFVTACKPEAATGPTGAGPAAQASESAASGAVLTPTEAAQAGEADEMTGRIQDSNMAMAARIGGSMHAAAELCGQTGAAELDRAKQGQKQAFVNAGGSEADFEAAYDQGYQGSKAKLEGAIRAERDQACRELEEMSGTAEAMRR